jgi:DNA-binding IclR family transcriptional regulator
MADDGFVLHYPEERRWGLGVSALELGTAYLRHDPLERLARPLLAALVKRLPNDLAAMATCGVLHGSDVLYVATESADRRLTVVAEVGVRLPASLTASGRAMLAHLPPAQLRALFPGPLVQRDGRGPTTLKQLRAELRDGVNVEDGLVTPGLSSVAAAVLSHDGLPAASIGITVRSTALGDQQRATLAAAVTRTAAELTRRLGHGNR